MYESFIFLLSSQQLSLLFLLFSHDSPVSEQPVFSTSFSCSLLEETPSSLTKWADFCFWHFLLCIGVTDTSSSGARHRSQSSSSASCFIVRSGGLLFPLRELNVLNRARQARARPQHLAAISVTIELPGWQHTFSKHFFNFSGFCTCLGVKFQDAGTPTILVLAQTIPHTLPLIAFQPWGRSLGRNPK